MEDEVPGVCEVLCHLSELVQVGTDSSFAFLELVGNIVENMSEVLNTVEYRVEGSVLELIDNTTEALPNVLGIAEALNTVGNLSLNGASEHTFEDLAHAEETEMDVRALHGFEVVHLLVLFVIDLIQKFLPMVVKVEEELLMVDHLGLSVEDHGGSLTEMLTSINPFAHTVVMKALTDILEGVNTVDDKRLVGLKEDLLGMEEGLGHSLDLLVVMMIDLATVVEHVADVRDSEAQLVDTFGGFLIRAVPEAAHGVLEVLLNGVGIRDAVGHVGHAMEVEGTHEETLHEARDLGVIMGIVC
jgi:hypothetical protein